MLLKRLFAPRPTLIAGRALYAAAARQARQPMFYQAMGVLDSVEGRFELYSLHVALLVLRLKNQGIEASETAQHLFDAFVRSLDDALREMGVSDVTVGKKMRKLGEAFYGRMRAYQEAIEQLPDARALEDLLERTVLEGRSSVPTGPLSTYVTRAVEALKQHSLAELLDGRTVWPEATHG